MTEQILNANKFLTKILRPTLCEIDIWSRSAEKLLLMTACHESGGFKSKVQLGGGPAVSYYQIEPETALDLYKNYARYRQGILNLLENYRTQKDGSDFPTLENIKENLQDNIFSTVVARILYKRVAEPLPARDDDKNLARYWKTYWNTAKGRGTSEQFLQSWQRYSPKNYR